MRSTSATSASSTARRSRATGRLEGYLFKDAVKNRVYVTKTPQKGAKTCCTLYRTLQTKNGLSLVECELITGRTHQIRAQMAAAGHPLLGDGKYGKLGKDPARTYQALYSYKLTFRFTTDAGCLSYLNGKTFTGRPTSILCRNTSPDTLPRTFAKISSENYTFFIDIPPFSIYDSTQYIRNAGCTVLLSFGWAALRKCTFGLRRSFRSPYNDAEDHKNPTRQIGQSAACGARRSFFARQRKAAGNPVGFPRIFLPYRGKDASGPCAEIWQFCRNIKMKRGMINVRKAHSLVESFHDI